MYNRLNFTEFRFPKPFKLSKWSSNRFKDPQTLQTRPPKYIAKFYRTFCVSSLSFLFQVVFVWGKTPLLGKLMVFKPKVLSCIDGCYNCKLENSLPRERMPLIRKWTFSVILFWYIRSVQCLSWYLRGCRTQGIFIISTVYALVWNFKEDCILKGRKLLLQKVNVWRSVNF